MARHEVRGPDIGKELGKSFAQIKSQIETVEHEAKRMGISAHDMTDSHGNYVLTPLLVAKAQVLHAIVLINHKP
jgi:hypothetical protein